LSAAAEAVEKGLSLAEAGRGGAPQSGPSAGWPPPIRYLVAELLSCGAAAKAAATREQTRATLEETRAALLHAQLLNTSAAPEAEPLLRALCRSRGEGGEAEAEAEAYRAWFAHLPALDPGPGETDPGAAAAAVEFVGGGGGGSSTHDEL